MSLGRYIRTIITISLLLIYGAGEVWAQVTANDIIIKVMPSGKEGKGSVTDATYGSVSASIGDSEYNQYYPVTLTVTPKAGYQTEAALIVAEKMVNPGEVSARLRAPGIGTFGVTGSGNTYTFNIDTKYHGAYVTVTFEKIPVAGDPTPISTLSELQSISASGNYILVRDIDASGLSESLDEEFTGKEFTGTLDGNYHKIFNIGVPLFNSVNGGTVKNVTFEDVSINVTSGDAGTVTALATGSARIYNCGILPSSTDYDNEGNIIGFSGSSISGSDNVGGLVGTLSGTARVINCYSYANITGGTTVGGIVGNNTGTTTSASLNTMVMNCMFYGNITSGNKAPIYNGTIITNDGDASGVNNFNYFWAGASYVKNKNINNYYCALSAETRFLQRFEFFRNLLNSNRELAAWWVKGSDGQKSDMAKWVLEPSQIGSNVPFPILKTPGKYASVVNYTPSEIAYNENHRNEGRKLTSMGTKGKLSVTIQLNSNTGNTPYSQPTGVGFKNGETGKFDLTITDKDTLHYNFNYGKVQLPYYNDYCNGNYTGNRVVTGWKIISITDGTAGNYYTGENVTYTAAGEFDKTPYNFADRKCTDKDLYDGTGEGKSGSDRVFNQGAYWDVPEGVTAITIEPYWGKAVYLSDAYWDVTYKNGTRNDKPNEAGYKEDAMTTSANVPNVGGGQRYNNGVSKFNDQLVYTSMSNAIASSGSGSALFQGVNTTNHTVYDYAVVLVGNYHHTDAIEADEAKPYTVTSVDLDGDNEPDYSLMLRFNGRTVFHPVRYDFLNLIGLGMAQKSFGGKGSYNLGIMQPKYWFEVTNTALLRVTQFEYDRSDRIAAPYILQGGIFEQWVSGQNNGVSNNTIYFHVGGNVWFKEFQLGTHIDQKHSSNHPPISVTGGDFKEFYLTGLYRGDVTSYNDNAECYINGGRFGVLAGAGQEGLGHATNHTNGNIAWQIDNADITEFYGGGFNQPIQGNITTFISNSYVEQFCGGPKFGDMITGKTVKTKAEKCTFGTYFGAGFGGNAYSREAPSNVNNINGDYTGWNTWVNGKYTQAYSGTYKGVSTKYDYQYLPMSNNTQNVARIFIDYVRFSLATTHEVTSLLTDCHITGNFYGGGSLGKVTGDVKSTLTNCSVDGSVFGAGYSASTPTVDVMNTGGFTTPPFYDENLGAYFEPEFPSTVSYTWQYKNGVNSTANAIDKTNHILYTSEDLDALGTVSGKAILNINGSTTVAGSVYGGGEESNVEGNTQVSICANYNDETKKWESESVVPGSSGLTITGNVFGGGKGVADSFTCEKALVGLLDQLDQSVGNTTVVIGNGTVNGSVYGGGEVGRVEHNSTVMIGAESGTSEPTINGSVYGAGAGLVTHGYSALVRGDATVTIQGKAKVKKNVYGGGETASVGRFSVVNSLPKEPLSGGTCTVTIQGEAQIGTDGDNNTGNVYGACKGVKPDYDHATVHWKNDNQPYTFTSEEEYLSFLKTLALTSNTVVTVDGSSIVRGSVYGGGERGVTLGYVEVDMTGGTVNHDVYGGGALADTNTANWNSTTSTLTDTYYEVTGLTAGTSVVTGLYTQSGSSYTKITDADAKAIDGTTYYRKTDTKVKLMGGTISGDAYGGGLGNSSTDTPAYVYGDVLVELNGETTDLGNDAFGSNPISSSSKGCVVSRIFGCNNIYGSPKGKVLVHVHSTQSSDAEATKIANVSEGDKNKVKGRYDVSAVYGGGNEAAYDPVITGTETEAVHAHTHVVIEGCDLTSIETVYGGGNAASTPSTKVEINGSYEINEVFGGGNGKDPLSDGSENLGANVGFYTYDDPDNATKEQKEAKKYGFGKAEVEIGGGIIHSVYGGSNQRGNVRLVAVAMLEKISNEACFTVDEAYGGGKSAPMDGRAELQLGCIPGVGEVYGGARNADVNNDVVLTITNGTYNRIFGGNNEGHSINGTITVNIEETGCTPIIIGQLFGGGNQAAYTAPLKSGSTTEREDGPTLNIKSFTSIGEIYGGGFSANVTGDTHININEIVGAQASAYTAKTITINEGTSTAYTVSIPGHTSGEIGTIGDVYGGGYGANVTGNTYVNIGTQSAVAYVSGTDHGNQTVEGANITGNVFGGGFGHETNVTGTATVNIGEVLTTEDPNTHVVTVTGYKDNNATFANDKGIYGGSALGTVANTQVNLYAGTIAANIFGGGKGQLAQSAVGTEGDEGYVPAIEAQGATVTTANVSLYTATVTGSIYGGCNDNGTTTTAVLDLIGGTVGSSDTTPVADKVFGGGQGHSTTTTNATVNVGTSTTVGTSKIYSNVYGGSALGEVGTAIVNLNKATTLTGDVFGGGMGSGTAATTAATVTTAASVWLNNVDIQTKNIYGGCNANGWAAATTIYLLGGNVYDVYGGGYGENTYVKGNVNVYVGKSDQTGDGTTVYHDVYGGSAKGHVNAEKGNNGQPTYTTYNGEIPNSDPVEYEQKRYTTNVDLYKGEIKGDVYGGGLGDENHAAYVGGDVTVSLNNNDGTCKVDGGIFGCNNLNGSPKGHVIVHIYKTVSRTGQTTGQYDLAAVYGGGDQADYTPDDERLSTEVVIEGCQKTSIQNVYGGGNAAAVPATEVWILGTKEIETVFGGGNGTVSAANVGFDSNGTAYTYGTGKAETKLVAGNVTTVFGGSNSNGDVRGGTWVTMPQRTEYSDYSATLTSCCDNFVAEHIYGGGQNADLSGGTNIVLGCQPSSWIEEIYAGSMEADVTGDVGLTITSGRFKRVFGGNKTSGKLKGSITLNIEETGGCDTPIIIGELYAGGNQADYSIYGYYQDTNDNNKWKGRTKAQYEEWFATLSDTEKAKPENQIKADPQLNVRAFTSIGAIYGGGYSAKMYGNPTVSINVVKGSKNTTVVGEGQSTPALAGTSTTLPYPAHASGAIGTIGNVFGGGNLATVYGSTTVNIGTESTVTFITEPAHLGTKGTDYTYDSTTQLYSATVEGANITGNVYGGGKLADVTGNTQINICAKEDDDPATTDVIEFTSVPLGTAGVTIGVSGVSDADHGNVFGGGKGEATTFACEKAMVGIDGAGIDTEHYPNYSDGNTTIVIGNGTVHGTVYGGGEIGRVEMNTSVTIGIGAGDATVTSTSSAPEIKGSVFGGGKGEKEHGYAALVRGNPTVTIAGNTKVKGSVYGGGEIASVARYKVPKSEDEVAAAIAEGYEAVLGMPYALEDNASGYCKVYVKGYAEIGPDNMKMYHSEITNGTDKPDDWGHVFAAGKGILPENYTYVDNNHRPKRMALYDGDKYNQSNSAYWAWVDPDHTDTNKNIWEYFPDEDHYFEFIRTLALASQTDVTIGDHAFVKGSVYGGSENGLVQFDTHVYINDDCQIGCGKNTTERHPDAVWGDSYTVPDGTNLECASWDYTSPYAPYDPNANATGDLDKYPLVTGQTAAKSTEGGRRIATDGHTYYGNVFGGGSGSIPYFDTSSGISRYIMSAGQVKGDANVTISGGHILTNVYGGCEATNVLGTATVSMTGGTVGVPRTIQQIIDHPVTCYLFGGGKGDQRIFFNKDTNVEGTVVSITGGRIYGSVFGGGEDGHVLGDVTMTIGQATGKTTKIGTWGTTYVDGNVFGGGRGFGGDALTAGNVAGSVDLDITGGTILGSVYGGGRLASVGYGLYLVDEAGKYGVMQDDGYGDWVKGSNNEYTRPTIANFKRGHIDIDISGGTIGNDYEYKYFAPNATIAEADRSTIPFTEFDDDNQLKHTKGGNVFAGGMGRMYKLGSTTEAISSLDWWKLGCAKSTKLTISGDAVIKSCVYGGGELGQVVGNHSAENAANENVNVGTEVIINGGEIGTEIKDANNNVKYTFGSVFGGGYGSLEEKLTHQVGNTTTYSYPKYIAGRVMAGTKVNMTGGTVRASVYGGGEMAAVGESKTLGEDLTDGFTGDTHVIISGGTIGKDKVVSGENVTYFGGAKMGNVYGGGSGHNNTVRSGHVYGNTNVTISGSPIIYHNVYGGGAYGSVGDFTYSTGTDVQTGTQKVNGISGLNTNHTNSGVARVTITGGTIGINGRENGMVFGSSRGDINKPEERDDYTAWVYDAHVTIGDANGGPAIKGSIYGSGENGHTFNDAVVTVNKGTIGISEGESITYTENGQSVTKGGAAYPYRGNVYGGGCGTDKYYANHSQETHDGNGQLFNPLAGIVYGTTTVNINGGTIVRNVYGAGAMGSVGKATTTEGVTTISGGQTTINVSGGTIGVSGSVGDGNVFGAARGNADATSNEFALVRDHTTVKITDGTVKGNVYGGGELGCVGTYVFTSDMKNFYWTNEELEDEKTNYTYNSTGVCNVTISGGTIGTGVDPSDDGIYANGNVFGAGKGIEDTWWCEKAIAYKTIVTITDGTIKGTVYGGGQIGRVETDAVVKIGTENESEGTGKPNITGNVFGAGAGVKTHGYSALVRGDATVTVQGVAQVGGSVYGGGEIASVGRFTVVDGLPKHPDSGGNCRVTIQDKAKIGASGTTHNVFGACKGVTPAYDASNYKSVFSMQTYENRPEPKETSGDTWDYYYNYSEGYQGQKFIKRYYKTEADYLDFLETLALTSHPIVTIAEDATVNGSVYGGGERGITLGSVEVNINGGTVAQDVYGGGALANSNKGNWETSTNTWAEGKTSASYTTKVNLMGGKINGSAYGGGLGRKAATDVSAIEAMVYGDVLVDLNGTTTLGTDGKPTLDSYGYPIGTRTTGNGCIVNQVFGCNNQNGTPKGNVVVHVYGTRHKDLASISAKYNPPYCDPDKSSNEGYKDYLQRLINAAYQQDENGNVTSPKTFITGIPESVKTNVTDAETVLSGLSSTTEASLTDEQKASITTAANNITQEFNKLYDVYAVYGGGNEAAYEPAIAWDGNAGSKTQVVIEGCDYTSIQYVYGGGNAAPVPETNILVKGNKIIDNLFGGGNGTVVGADVGYKKDGTNQGTGNVSINLMAGNIHNVFNGSNTNGDIRGNVSRQTVNIPEGTTTGTGEACCSVLHVNKYFGAGKNADINGDLIDVIDCQQDTWIDEYYGGAENANVKGNVELTIHSGKIRKLFGGNKTKGAIFGHIILNIEETGNCAPIMIDELYGCGNDAAYSIYGYYHAKDPNTQELLYLDPETKQKPLYLPRTAEMHNMDPEDPDYVAPAENPATDATHKFPYDPPVLNIVSATHIGKVYGGGYGENGTVYGSPTVNINMIPGSHAQAELGGADKLGTIDDVYGGGNAAAVIGNTTVNIGTEQTVKLHESLQADAVNYNWSEEQNVLGVNITGNVYGGGNEADVTGNTYVNICANYDAAEGKYVPVPEDASGVTISGNVFGGGKGKADSFECAKAMIGVNNDGDPGTDTAIPDGGTTVVIGNGTIEGTVYGGGEIGRVERNTVVKIGLGAGEAPGGTGTPASAPWIKGNVFGAGAGVETHGYSALVRGKTTVTIQGNAKVDNCVYGGGMIASVGRYNVKGSPDVTEPAPTWVPEGMAYSLKHPDTESGNCYVTIGGYAEIGLDNMKMPTFSGHVFGAGKGILPHEYPYLATDPTKAYTGDKPQRRKNDNTMADIDTEPAYITFIETLGMTGRTYVNIEDHAFVKGSVYGGSENGHVMYDTHVTIDGDCQVGNGDGVNARYTDWTAASLKECAHWPYGKQTGTDTDGNPIMKYLPYDVYDLSTDNKPIAASDGHTFYGNVFGGGSGYFPYRHNPAWQKHDVKTAEVGQPVDENGYSDGIWLRSAGAVYGNTYVDIKKGHILTSVYGGNECTDVGKYPAGNITPDANTGTCYVNMIGGTIGVPRSEGEINAHPVTCCLYGAGKGDQRINFNTWTNVGSTQVKVSGEARIFGSVFGGGEDGHVIGDAETSIGGTVTIGGTNYSNSGVIIGTTGTSGCDGNIFGGGRGFSGEAQTAGTVGGDVRLTIEDGAILGNVYGGGRLASVGTLFSQPEDPNYGQFEEDNVTVYYTQAECDEYNTTYGLTSTDTGFRTTSDVKKPGGPHGHITVNISGGTIGIDDGGLESGNVYGGSMGRLDLLDGRINPIWPKMAQVKTSTVNISQTEGKTTLVKRNVYGGGELGTVREDAAISITKGTINGSVYGGGFGSEDYDNSTTVKVYWNNAPAYYTYTPMQWAGLVGGNTTVSVAGGLVKQNVYGGGQMASVGIIDYSVEADGNGPFEYEGAKYSYHSVKKHADITDPGETTEKVYGFGLSWPYEFTYVPCNPDGFIGGKSTVTVSGGRIGTGWNDGTGYVYGGGKGKAFERYTEAFCANVRETEVNINYTTTPDPDNVSTADCIASAVYGGGEDGHVYENAAVNITKGLIGLSVYGGGKGEGTYPGKLRSRDGNHEWNNEPVNLPSWTAGKVYGNTSVNMSGGHVLVNVYGGGNMGSVGKGNYAGGTDDYYPAGYGETLKDEGLWTKTANFDPDAPITESNKPTTMADYFLSSGKCTVTITGGTVGTENGMYGTVGNLDQASPTGMVFGGSRGRSAEDIGALSPRYAFAPDFFLGYVNNTEVTIGDASGGPTIYSQVFGGARDGHVRNSTHVIINKGTIGQSYTTSTDDYQRRNRGNVYGSGSGMGTWNGTNHGTSSGSVTRNTIVDINDGTIYGNVYGGGAMSSVGPPKITKPDYAPENWSKCTVNINGGNIGGTDYSTYGYGGCVFGASRGGDLTTDEFSEGNLDNYATTLWNEVNIKGGNIAGDVYGGGQAGRVKKDNTVNLTGGTVAHDVFGGGMGTSTIAANVGGNTTVTLNGTPTSGEGGTVSYLDNCVVNGSIFGANNVNGTPKGHVTVHVFKTANSAKDPSVLAANRTTYDVAAVFGGGKQADYVPDATDTKQSTEVIIEGCDLTSIKEVYGGGYGAATPGTNVLIKGTYIIDNVFGGGYGAGDDNPGANVGFTTEGTRNPYTDGEGKAVVQLMAGTIHHVYGGSNTKGDIRGGSNVTSVARDINVDVSPNCCTDLNVQEIFGGGSQADMYGGTEIVLGCMPNDWIGAIYAGAESSNVGNDVSLTLTSGKFGRVFGGNKSGGSISGSIEVNIEENPDCGTPIIIGELYGGGDAAPYSVPESYTQNDPNYKSPRVNVRAFTSIGNIFGGGYGAEAIVTGNPMVNINEVKLTNADGTAAGKAYDPATDEKPELINGTTVKLYPHEAGKIGVIGNVFGGGNAAEVRGSTYVNIGTEAETPFVSLPMVPVVDANNQPVYETDQNGNPVYEVVNGQRVQETDANGNLVYESDGVTPKWKRVQKKTPQTKPVVGADIQGNVYGGGNAAKVTGNTNVVIGQEKTTSTTTNP